MSFFFHPINDIQFEIYYRYGEPYPNFYEGTLEEALGEACHKPAKDVRLRSLSKKKKKKSLKPF